MDRRWKFAVLLVLSAGWIILITPMMTTWYFHGKTPTPMPKRRVFVTNGTTLGPAILGKVNPPSLDQVTCPNKTKIVVLNRDRLFRQGDVLEVRVTARDAEGRPKTHGGDFFRARLIGNLTLQESSAGQVTDHSNGSYTVQFPLYWVGDVSVWIQLVHPSKAVEVLQRVRQVPNKRTFHCTFVGVKTGVTEERQCFSAPYPNLPLHQQCDLSKADANGTWFCERPEKLPCNSISMCRFIFNNAKLLDLVSQEEKKFFKKPYLEEELEANLSVPIRVHPPAVRMPSPADLPACPGNESASLTPGTQGHWSRGVWKSSICNVQVFKTTDVQRCLANKTVYLHVVLKSASNTEWNVAAHFRFHHVPIEKQLPYPFFNLSYAADQLDAIQGGPNTVVVLSLWAHFTEEPLDMIRSRLHAIRHAIHRLQRRDPGTHVFIRTGTTREHTGQSLIHYLLGSDWLAYQITEEIRDIFREDPDVVVLDFWDMTVCQWGRDNVHPDQTVVDNEINMLLSRVCPK
ncbi:NXPE family member 3-like [Branchiostoma floridae]|uniref:NXPE family member 3-like n=1 Tax=Branchiostoma floridae TaxID=7739 RepID=A0A9J7L6I6_BRAFL|nr:NXPE family member 3-like [Branchiostoma floridae]